MNPFVIFNTPGGYHIGIVVDGKMYSHLFEESDIDGISRIAKSLHAWYEERDMDWVRSEIRAGFFTELSERTLVEYRGKWSRLSESELIA